MLGNEDSKKHRVRMTPVSLLPGDRKERLCAMAAEARQVAEDRFDNQKLLEKLERVIRETVAG